MPGLGHICYIFAILNRWLLGYHITSGTQRACNHKVAQSTQSRHELWRLDVTVGIYEPDLSHHLYHCWPMEVHGGPRVPIGGPRASMGRSYGGPWLTGFDGTPWAPMGGRYINKLQINRTADVTGTIFVRMSVDGGMPSTCILLQVGANLFIGNLEPECDEKMLYDTFSSFGVAFAC